MPYLKPHVSFSLKFSSLFNVMRDKSSVLFFAETFYDFYKRSPPKCNISDFWLLGKISPNLYFDRLLLLKFYKILAKKVQRSYVSWYWRVVQNLKKNRFFVSKTGWILIRALKSLKKFGFDWSLLCKVYNIWPKKVQRSYISRHWRVMQNLKKNWLVVWKMTWGIWQIFTKTLKSLKIGTLMGSFYPK